MLEVNTHEAKTHLSRLLRRVAAGEEVVISRAGKRLARLVPYKGARQQRVLGVDGGLYHVPEDFNAPLPKDLMAAFEGNS